MFAAGLTLSKEFPKSQWYTRSSVSPGRIFFCDFGSVDRKMKLAALAGFWPPWRGEGSTYVSTTAILVQLDLISLTFHSHVPQRLPRTWLNMSHACLSRKIRPRRHYYVCRKLYMQHRLYERYVYAESISHPHEAPGRRDEEKGGNSNRSDDLLLSRTTVLGSASARGRTVDDNMVGRRKTRRNTHEAGKPCLRIVSKTNHGAPGGQARAEDYSVAVSAAD